MKIAANKISIIFIKIFLLLVIFLVLSSCTQNNVSNKNPLNEEAHQAYQSVLDEAKKASQEVGTLQISGNAADNYANSLKFIIYDGEDIPTQYIFLDLDNDGVDELLLSNGSFVRQVFGYINGQVYKTMYGWARNRYYLTNDKLFRYEGSGGAAYGEIAAIKYEVKDTSSYSHGANTTALESASWSPVSSTELKLITRNIEGEEKTETISNSQLKANTQFKENYPTQEVEWLDI